MGIGVPCELGGHRNEIEMSVAEVERDHPVLRRAVQVQRQGFSGQQMDRDSVRTESVDDQDVEGGITQLVAQDDAAVTDEHLGVVS